MKSVVFPSLSYYLVTSRLCFWSFLLVVCVGAALLVVAVSSLELITILLFSCLHNIVLFPSLYFPKHALPHAGSPSERVSEARMAFYHVIQDALIGACVQNVP